MIHLPILRLMGTWVIFSLVVLHEHMGPFLLVRYIPKNCFRAHTHI